MTTTTNGVAFPEKVVGIITPEQRQEVAELVAMAEGVAVTDGASKASAEALAKELAKLGKQIEAKRTELKAPALAYERAVDAAAKEACARIKPSIDHVGQVVMAFEFEERQRHAAEQRKREAEARRLQEEEDARARAAAAFMPADTPVAETLPARVAVPLAAPPEKSSVFRTRTDITVEIVDVSQIPREFMVPDLKKLEAVGKAGVQVAGVRFITEQVVQRNGGRL